MISIYGLNGNGPNNALGYQERVQAPGGATVDYQMLDTDAAGRSTTEWLGDGSTGTRAYEANSDRVNHQQSVNGSTTIQHFTYAYDNAGNMTTRSV